MTAPTPYLHFPGNAREALTFYQSVFGGAVTLITNGDMGRTDGTVDAIGHGMLVGPVSLFAADADEQQKSFEASGLMFSLLGEADSATLTEWFHGLSDGGTVVDDLQVRPWGDSDGQVRDRFGLLWLIGFEPGK
ncbi:MAG TPA: VOC family protein [Galbitalea sp.]|nr:VOC family protein [Galbitalea sp.]